MIGQCIILDDARIAQSLGDKAVRFDNPLLPNTRSELALPLRARGQVIGAMSVQSEEVAAFDEADIAVLQTMADQVAVAIDNAQLFAEAQEALHRLEVAQRRYLEQAWSEYMRAASAPSYETELPGAAPLGDEVLTEIQLAQERRSPTVVLPSSADPSSGSESSLARDPASGDQRVTGRSALVAPILLGGVPIGTLGIHDDRGTRRWTQEEIALVEEIAGRMALIAEQMRLLQETQRSAAHDQLIADITARFRETLDTRLVLETAANELYQRLGLDKVALHLASGDGNGDSAQAVKGNDDVDSN